MLSPSIRFAGYEIGALIGKGGMGEVYRARDTRLGRDVAIKILRSDLHLDNGSQTRLDREARALAALSHANVLAIHDVGTYEGRIYAVTELLEGETLRARLDRGPLSWPNAVEIAVAIADALGAAHAKGIVHCDLKPANVFLTADGRVKVLDFGVARLLHDRDGLSGQDDPTAERRVFGTTPYMAPERISGDTVDGRADIFALGCLLHEMIGGRQPFARGTVTETMGAILTHEAEPLSTVPPAVRRIVSQCLEKGRESRFQSARDLAIVLRVLVESDTAVTVSGRAAAAERRWPAAAAVTAVVALGIAGLAVGSWSGGNAFESAVIRSSLLPPENTTFELMSGEGKIALSPDGRHVAFISSDEDGITWLWARSLNATSARRLPQTKRARDPFWSPDSRWLAFTAEGALRKIHLDEGVPITLCPGGGPGAWSPQGIIVWSPLFWDPLFQVDSAGGPCKPLTVLNAAKGERTHRWPTFLPDGRRVLYHSQNMKDPQLSGIYVSSLDSSPPAFVLQTKHRALATSNHLLFVRQRALLAVPFDAARARTSGTPVALTEQLLADEEALFSVSSTGLLAFAETNARYQFAWFDRSGKALGWLPMQDVYGPPAISHDGRRVAFQRRDPDTLNRDLWVYDLDRLVAARLTSDAMDDMFPVWSPDDREIAFTSNRLGPHVVFRINSIGAPAEQPIRTGSTKAGQEFIRGRATSWSRDGRVLALEGGKPMSLLSLPERRETLLPAGAVGRMSPDGRWIAYVSSETGSGEVWIRGMPPDERRWRVSVAEGMSPRWRADGKELFFWQPGRTGETRGKGSMMSVQVRSGEPLELGLPRRLFEGIDDAAMGTDIFAGWYDVTADGQKFLLRSITHRHNIPITLVQNWTKLVDR